VVNLQGDLPTIEPGDMRAALSVLNNASFDIGTIAAPITDADEAALASVVKIAGTAGPGPGRALYFSRAPIPHGNGPRWHHVGVYAWRRTALARFVALVPSALEQRESLEQLRALEAGMTIGFAPIACAPFGVDTPEDLVRARRTLVAA
jgi:3-deoxy-manno-octulosonate cytidylyltransferase (CMP-KDO synthetase)